MDDEKEVSRYDLAPIMAYLESFGAGRISTAKQMIAGAAALLFLLVNFVGTVIDKPDIFSAMEKLGVAAGLIAGLVSLLLGFWNLRIETKYHDLSAALMAAVRAKDQDRRKLVNDKIVKLADQPLFKSRERIVINSVAVAVVASTTAFLLIVF